MKLVTFERAGAAVPGLFYDGRIYAFDDLAPGLPPSIESLLQAGEPAMDILLRAAEQIGIQEAAEGLPIGEVHLLSPLTRPQKFLGIGLNYASHVAEMQKQGEPAPDLGIQMWFNKQVSCINGPYDPIHLPSVSECLDFEGELGIVIGTRCRHVAPADAHKVIVGYVIVNDVSVRDWQRRSPTATIGKSFDTHGPIGPWLTTADEIADPEALAIRTTVDGVVMQDANTSEFIHKIGAMIAYLTTALTLEPGDILATGTPPGVGAGRKPPTWLRAGQKVRVEIDGLGFIENEVIAEPLAQTTTVFI
jgi:2-keto-4-pentenoate hydratase/2-oxohepta-3-ene-1,7-dioic acid hydratase in catechol pathway